MNKTIWNEPAMPIQYEEEYGDHGRKYNKIFEGLTKREHFAAMAMQGLIAAKYDFDTPAVAEWSVKFADSLIEELNK